MLYCTNSHEDARLAAAGFTPPAPGAKKRAAAAPKASSSKKKAKADDDDDDGAISSGTPASGAKRTKDVAVLLAKKFELGGKVDPEGWWVSEKCELVWMLNGSERR